MTMWKQKKILFYVIAFQLWLMTVDARVDICASVCRCMNESHFVKIHCDFIENKVRRVISEISIEKHNNLSC